MGNSSNTPSFKRFWRAGEPFIWASGGALALTLLTTIALVAVLLVNGFGAFWPARMARLTLHDGTCVLGPVRQIDSGDAHTPPRTQIKVGNRDLYGLDFRWVSDADVLQREYPADAVAVERREYGDFYGFLQEVRLSAQPGAPSNSTWDELQRAVSLVQEMSKPDDATMDPPAAALAVFADAAGTTVTVPVANIVRLYRPNAMSLGEKIVFYADKTRELLWEDPRESNTEGGLFPAIFGTVCLVFLMSLVSFPLGVLAGIYLTEYARAGFMVRAVHIAVNNLAGIPSIVYGIFGLGFFVYGIGGSIDRLFFADRLPTPTFGTGGILWAGMTLGLLTVPVVIVATEEALNAVPKGVREGSYALGATRLQTLARTVLPMASPGIMTGLILAMARAAGEVAPLMITGVVKLAPALPIDGAFPYVHLDRKFMHLGFHIYDMGFQSPNAEAAKPMVFVTAFLLVFIVLIMSSAAIYLRKRMRDRYALRSL